MAPPPPPPDTGGGLLDDPLSFYDGSSSRFRDETDFFDLFLGDERSPFANFVYSPKIKYAWTLLIFSCILDRVFPDSKSPVPKRLSKNLSHVKLFIACAYPLAAASHILSHLKEITSGAFDTEVAMSIMEALPVVRLYYILGGILTASWMFGWRKQLDLIRGRWVIPFPVFLLASIAFPIGIWTLLETELLHKRMVFKLLIFSGEMFFVVVDFLVLLYSLYCYIRNGIFDRPRYQLIIFLALFTSWLYTVALSSLLEYRFWDTLLRYGLDIHPRGTHTCRPFPSLPSSLQPCIIRRQSYWTPLGSTFRPQDESSTRTYALRFNIPASVLFSRSVWEVNSYDRSWLIYALKFGDGDPLQKIMSVQNFITVRAWTILFTVSLLGTVANRTGSTWLAAVYGLTQRDIMDDVWSVLRSLVVMRFISFYPTFEAISLFALDWINRVVMVFYRVELYFPPQYTRFKQAQLLQLGIEWTFKAALAVSLIGAVIRTKGWILSVKEGWGKKEIKEVKGGEDKDLTS